MTEVEIVEVGIDAQERLYVTPSTFSFDHICRAAMEVNWDKDKKRLFSAKPRDWTYHKWFDQIVAAVADEYGVHLIVTPKTSWSNVPAQLKSDILAALGN